MNLALVVHAATWNTVDEFLKAAKAKTLSGGISGVGGTSHLAGLVARNPYCADVPTTKDSGIAATLIPRTGVQAPPHSPGG